MAAGPFVIANKAKLNLFNATGLANGAITNYYFALLGASFTPVGTEEVWADLSANEIANGNGYTTNGAAATGGSLSGATGTVTFGPTWASPTWTASGAGIPSFGYACLYYRGTLNSKVNPIVGWFQGNAGGVVPLTPAGNTITLTDPTGVFKAA